MSPDWSRPKSDQIRSNLQEIAARGESYRFNNLRDKVKQQLDSCKEIEATCDNQMSRWQEEPQEHGQSHDQVVSEDCLKRKSLEGTNALNEQREDNGEGGDVVRVWRKEATRS